MMLKHERDLVGDYQKRFLMHIGIGMLAGIPLLGYPIIQLFIRYEENEDVHTQDQAWKDYAGAICGAIIMELIVLAFIAYGILRFVYGN